MTHSPVLALVPPAEDGADTMLTINAAVVALMGHFNEDNRRTVWEADDELEYVMGTYAAETGDTSPEPEPAALLEWARTTDALTDGCDDMLAPQLRLDPENPRIIQRKWRRNPDAIWDWWRYGGRWGGLLLLDGVVDEAALTDEQRRWRAHCLQESQTLLWRISPNSPVGVIGQEGAVDMLRHVGRVRELPAPETITSRSWGRAMLGVDMVAHIRGWQPPADDALEPHEQYPNIAQTVCYYDEAGLPAYAQRGYAARHPRGGERLSDAEYRAADILVHQQWAEQYHAILAQRPDHWAVLLDCHI
jgi:hypothetical protein